MAPRYPRGRLNAEDEGATEMAVFTTDRTVIIRFRTPMAWVGLDADTALCLASALTKHALGLKGPLS